MFILMLALAPATPLQRCLDTGYAAQGSIAAMAACWSAEYHRADARVNATYRAVMARLSPARRAALRQSQRSWIRTRDAACPSGTSEGAGAIERLNHPACLIRQTERRTDWLTRYR